MDTIVSTKHHQSNLWPFKGFRTTLWIHPFINMECPSWKDVAFSPKSYFIKDSKTNQESVWIHTQRSQNWENLNCILKYNLIKEREMWTLKLTGRRAPTRNAVLVARRHRERYRLYRFCRQRMVDRTVAKFATGNNCSIFLSIVVNKEWATLYLSCRKQGSTRSSSTPERHCTCPPHSPWGQTPPHGQTGTWLFTAYQTN